MNKHPGKFVVYWTAESTQAELSIYNNNRFKARHKGFDTVDKAQALYDKLRILEATKKPYQMCLVSNVAMNITSIR